MFILISSLILGIVSAMIGAFWIMTIQPYMIFSNLGYWIDDHACEYRASVELDFKPPRLSKLIKAFGCIYCVSTWICIIIYSIIVLSTYSPFNFWWFIFGLFVCIGITYISVLFIVLLKLKIENYEK